jgi:hypothetical protein
MVMRNNSNTPNTRKVIQECRDISEKGNRRSPNHEVKVLYRFLIIVQGVGVTTRPIDYCRVKT